MSGCFYCRNHCDQRPHPSGKGWAYTCKHGLDTEKVVGGPEAVVACPNGDVQFGFQVGGYYRHMSFDGHQPNGLNTCLDWRIQGDTEFPHNPDTEIHLCDWHQVEEWVAFWGKELRRRGWVADDPE